MANLITLSIIRVSGKRISLICFRYWIGSRSYAIVGQGTIGKIADAKPEELRVFLEEASGISKYRIRRKETENRLIDSKESINRISDLIAELDDGTLVLEKQAKIAGMYKNKNDERNNYQLFIMYKKK